MSVPRSTNCAHYTDSVSTLVSAEARGSTDRCVATATAFSCQTMAFEKPDAATERMLRAALDEELTSKGCDPQAASYRFDTNQVGARAREYSAKELVTRGMASNCFAVGNDTSQATHTATARCTPQYDMTDANGNRVRNTNMHFLSNLATCAVDDDEMPPLYEDLRKVAAHNAAENGYTVDKPEHLACDFSVLPHL